MNGLNVSRQMYLIEHGVPTVVLVTFNSETGETSHRYPGVRITPFVNLKKSRFGRFESTIVSILLSGFLVWGVFFCYITRTHKSF